MTKHTAWLLQSAQKHSFALSQCFKSNTTCYHLIHTIINQTRHNYLQMRGESTLQQMPHHSCTWAHIISLEYEWHYHIIWNCQCFRLRNYISPPLSHWACIAEVAPKLQVPQAARLCSASIFQCNSTCKVWLDSKMYKKCAMASGLVDWCASEHTLQLSSWNLYVSLVITPSSNFFTIGSSSHTGQLIQKKSVQENSKHFDGKLIHAQQLLQDTGWTNTFVLMVWPC